MRNADENSEVGSAFEIEDESGIFDRLPCGLEEKPVLRIHIWSFPWRNAKELRVKLIDGINKSGPQRDGFASYARFSIIISLYIPAIGRHFNDAFPAFDKKLPKGILRTRATGETAADSNYCNAVFLHGGEMLRGAD
jgi:hypothetical protein